MWFVFLSYNGAKCVAVWIALLLSSPWSPCYNYRCACTEDDQRYGMVLRKKMAVVDTTAVNWTRPIPVALKAAFKDISFFFFFVAYLLTIVSVYRERGLVIAFTTVAQWKNAGRAWERSVRFPANGTPMPAFLLFIEPLASTLLHAVVYLFRQ